MKDKGFMLVDSLLAMLIFGIIISVLMPAVMMLEQTMTESEETLEFNRRLYLEILSHEDFEAFRRSTSSYMIHDNRICSIKNEKRCAYFE
ncbi:type II secretion system protein [Salinicoccus roseus]|uniref:type II secretion system protein n=1 Tax=Salinicoccus roseus TaxID=45670 RepID=UPI0015849DE1|nr:type II secretion system protein [Salinicoccus roseus]